jgi:hypothetical protein
VLTRHGGGGSSNGRHFSDRTYTPLEIAPKLTRCQLSFVKYVARMVTGASGMALAGVIWVLAFVRTLTESKRCVGALDFMWMQGSEAMVGMAVYHISTIELR